MPLSLNKLRQQKGQVTLVYEGDDLTVTYRPYNAEKEEVFAEAPDARRVDALAKLLSELIIDWDLVGDSSEKMPITFEVLRPLPFGFLLAVFQAISNDQVPNQNGARK